MDGVSPFSSFIVSGRKDVWELGTQIFAGFGVSRNFDSTALYQSFHYDPTSTSQTGLFLFILLHIAQHNKVQHSTAQL